MAENIPFVSCPLLPPIPVFSSLPPSSLEACFCGLLPRPLGDSAFLPHSTNVKKKIFFLRNLSFCLPELLVGRFVLCLLCLWIAAFGRGFGYPWIWCFGSFGVVGLRMCLALWCSVLSWSSYIRNLCILSFWFSWWVYEEMCPPILLLSQTFLCSWGVSSLR